MKLNPLNLVTRVIATRPAGPKPSRPASPFLEEMESRTLMSAVVFVGGWGSSMYQYSHASNDAPSIEVAVKRG